MNNKSIEIVNRLLLLVPYVVSRGGARISDICEDFNMTYDELISCIRGTLWFCGLPDYNPYNLIDYEIDGNMLKFYSADYFRKPLKLTPNEALVLLIACKALVRSGLITQTDSLKRAMEKVQDVLSAQICGELEDISGRIDVEMKNFSKNWCKILEKGITSRRRLLLDYYSYSKDEVNTREVEPISFVWSNGNWYLLAFCCVKNEVRFFMLDRFRDVKVTRKKCRIQIEGEKYLPESICEYCPTGAGYTVELIFSDRMLLPFVERFRGAEIKEKKNGTIFVRFETKNLSWVANSLLKFGEKVTIVSPDDLKSLVRDKAETILKYYV